MHTAISGTAEAGLGWCQATRPPGQTCWSVSRKPEQIHTRASSSPRRAGRPPEGGPVLPTSVPSGSWASGHGPPCVLTWECSPEDSCGHAAPGWPGLPGRGRSRALGRSKAHGWGRNLGGAVEAPAGRGPLARWPATPPWPCLTAWAWRPLRPCRVCRVREPGAHVAGQGNRQSAGGGHGHSVVLMWAPGWKPQCGAA